jgi:hypothetical protein
LQRKQHNARFRDPNYLRVVLDLVVEQTVPKRSFYRIVDLGVVAIDHDVFVYRVVFTVFRTTPNKYISIGVNRFFP